MLMLSCCCTCGGGALMRRCYCGDANIVMWCCVGAKVVLSDAEVLLSDAVVVVNDT